MTFFEGRCIHHVIEETEETANKKPRRVQVKRKLAKLFVER